jgi:hypothetical protein
MIFKINIIVVIFHQISSAIWGMQNEKGVHFFAVQKFVSICYRCK